MNFSYPKTEKLKSRKLIDSLFSEGKSVARYPLRLVYAKAELDTNIKFGVSVSKKYFKKAVDRNYFKRVLREAYRLNKHLLLDNQNTKYAYMLLYQSKETLTFAEINTKTIELFQKFRQQTIVNDNPVDTF